MLKLSTILTIWYVWASLRESLPVRSGQPRRERRVHVHVHVQLHASLSIHGAYCSIPPNQCYGLAVFLRLHKYRPQPTLGVDFLAFCCVATTLSITTSPHQREKYIRHSLPERRGNIQPIYTLQGKYTGKLATH
ncbi:uncharacterized protein MYCFIDRAFT_169918 [Pseudocercospora fijiensis CIRAD86]|uniref:Secreted protein n=1 Tax=Pseudocercospora fijiensis (strain CIRAD86) TaxID=383855 RepID=N1Q914_PSEFD|nr:uncharacterized protein MYCFIDRAFT_169918 [Pseudocercospora fijiensis CIRAD86]EME88271.1 hypothetical protein MYCFIDRAFT_169918 [Pseudocercospora fijiensis CIRAD86]